MVSDVLEKEKKGENGYPFEKEKGEVMKNDQMKGEKMNWYDLAHEQENQGENGDFLDVETRKVVKNNQKKGQEAEKCHKPASTIR